MTATSTFPSGNARQGPLSGFRILDLTANMTGPYATMILAEQGADVIKVEPPGGEVMRTVGTGKPGMSVYFANMNRGKRSIVIDLKTDEGRDLVRRLALDADAVVQNFRPGVIDELGLGADTLRAADPSLVYVSISGFGRKGPYAEAPAYDHVVQALSGMAARNAHPKVGEPALVRHGVVDKTTGLVASQAITAALLGRERTGLGDHVELTMVDSAIHYLWPDGMMNYTAIDEEPHMADLGAGFRLTETADGYIAMITVTDKQWRGLMLAVGLEAELESPDLETLQDRMRNGGRVMRMAADVLKTLPTDDVVERLHEQDVPCGPVVALGELREQPQIVEMGAIEEYDHPVLGRLAQPRPSAQFEDAGDVPLLPAPMPGQDTDEVLAGAGVAADEVESLRTAGIVA
jgi:crotonobetainyl-CoA:carnitine CoA-transferase CaiB-like acyl-CoA transferase